VHVDEALFARIKRSQEPGFVRTQDKKLIWGKECTFTGKSRGRKMFLYFWA